MRITRNKLSDKKMAMFTRRLLYAYEGGIPLKRAFELMAEESRDRNLKQLVRDIANAIEAGYGLEEALEAQRDLLDGFFVDIVAAGERSGTLKEALEALNVWYDDQLAFRSALMYAFGYYLILFIVIGYFLYPLISFVLKDASPMVLFWAVAGFLKDLVIFYVLLRLGVVRWVWRRFSGYVWPFSDLTRDLNLSRFCRVFAISSGRLSFYESWTRAAETIWNGRIRRDLMRVPDRVREGAAVGQAALECRTLPDLVKQMIVTGENTGKDDECFRKASDYLRERAMHRAKTMSLVMGSLFIMYIIMQSALAVGLGLGSLIL